MDVGPNLQHLRKVDPHPPCGHLPPQAGKGKDAQVPTG
jgi:hypothetical protein